MNKARLAAMGCLVFAFPAGAAPIPPKVKAAVALILVEDEKQPGTLQAKGTAFFVGVEVPGQVDRSVVYLVTAAHVLQRGTAPKSVWREHAYVRLNTLEGGSEVAKLPILDAQGELLPLVLRDDTVDLAAIRVSPDPNRFDYKMVVASMLASQHDFSSLPIREGSELFFVGLFAPRPEKSKTLAIVRSGRVAVLPDGKIDWDGRATEIYLMETGSIEGHSGSPVFFQAGADAAPGVVPAGNPIFKLAGVVQGAFGDLQGIAAVIPAYALRDLLFSEQAKQQRGF